MSDRLLRYRPILMADSADRYLQGVEMFGAECDIGDGQTILQYWFAWPGDPDHAGIDWEHASVLLQDGSPGLVALAQHRSGQRMPWRHVELEDARPVLYAGRDKHSTRPRRGWYHHGWHLERANGRVRLDLPLRLDVPVAVEHRRAYRDPRGWLVALPVRRRMLS
jgi:hypothetical protein